MLFPRILACLCAVFWGSVAPSSASAQDAENTVRVAAAAELIDSGLIAWLAPRFRFKTRIAVDAVPYVDGVAADLLLLDAETAATAASPDVARVPIASRDAAEFLAIVAGDDPTNAKKLVSWLVSKAGLRAIEKFAPETGLAFGPPGAAPRAQTADAAPSVDDRGEKLAFQHCGRCHVISERNKYGGIGSTPSFPALRAIPSWKEKFDAFWTLNPHPSFTQVEGVTPPFPEGRPPHIAPVELTLDEAEAIIAFAAGIPPKDLGAPVKGD